jgi:hypothetical protein
MAKQQGELGAGVGEIRGETEGLWYRASWCVVSIKQAPSRDLNRHFLPPPVLAVETAGEHGGAGDADSALSSSGGHELIKKIDFLASPRTCTSPGGACTRSGFLYAIAACPAPPSQAPVPRVSYIWWTQAAVHPPTQLTARRLAAVFMGWRGLKSPLNYLPFEATRLFPTQRTCRGV